MKFNIAYILGAAISGDANGVKVQAETWAKGLIGAGHKVDLINPWSHYDWQAFDIIHFFGYGAWLEIIPALADRTEAKLVLSPIIDSNRPPFLQKLASHCGIDLLHMTSPLKSLRKVERYLSMYCVRSDYEKDYIQKSLDVAPWKVTRVPVSCKFSAYEFDSGIKKELFCLHVSILSSSNKNVKRLVAAAVKFKFRLILAGNAGTNDFSEYIASVTREHSNVEYLGFLSENELAGLFSKARVFALPSLFEGVGLVALEAAALGADIVLTERGGPKEYYNGFAKLVNPSSVDEIGNAICEFLDGETAQPELSHHISSQYSLGASAEALVRVYDHL